MGLPSRDYYLNKTDKNIVLDAYLIYMIKVAELMGGTNVDGQMKDILQFEKKLAAVSPLTMKMVALCVVQRFANQIELNLLHLHSHRLQFRRTSAVMTSECTISSN